MRTRTSRLAPVLAIMALAVSSAAAQAATVQAGGEGASGKVLQIFSANLEFHEGGISIRCEESDLGVLMLTNEKGIVAGGHFTDAKGKPCSTSTPGISVDVSTFGGEPMGLWAVQFEAGDQGRFESKTVIGFNYEFQFDGANIGSCKYRREFVNFGYTQDPEDLVLTLSTEFLLEGTPDVLCEEEGVLQGEFDVLNETGQVTVD